MKNNINIQKYRNRIILLNLLRCNNSITDYLFHEVDRSYIDNYLNSTRIYIF